MPVIDRRICETLGGTPMPLPLEKDDPGGSVGRSLPLTPWMLRDVIMEPGVANLEDPDTRPGAWLWDLDW